MRSRRELNPRGARVRTRASLLAALAVAAAALAAGCGDDDTAGPGEATPPSRATARDLLTSWFERAYATKDSLRYEEMLDDEFEYIHFLIADAESLQSGGLLPPGQAWWGKTLELRSAGRMFRSDSVGEIMLDIRVDSESESSDPECEGCREVETMISLQVTVTPQARDPLVLTVESPHTFVVREAPADTTKWVVWRQIDHEPFSEFGWGRVKALFF